MVFNRLCAPDSKLGCLRWLETVAMRLKARATTASPRTALDLLARIQKRTAHAGKRSFHGLSKTTPEQLDLFDALSLPKPA